MSNDLENLYDLIDELLVIDLVTDEELGMHVRNWYEKKNRPQDDVDWEDLNGDGDWNINWD